MATEFVPILIRLRSSNLDAQTPDKKFLMKQC